LSNTTASGGFILARNNTPQRDVVLSRHFSITGQRHDKIRGSRKCANG
jgi:hypothetical protein